MFAALDSEKAKMNARNGMAADDVGRTGGQKLAAARRAAERRRRCALLLSMAADNSRGGMAAGSAGGAFWNLSVSSRFAAPKNGGGACWQRRAAPLPGAMPRCEGRKARMRRMKAGVRLCLYAAVLRDGGGKAFGSAVYLSVPSASDGMAAVLSVAESGAHSVAGCGRWLLLFELGA